MIIYGVYIITEGGELLFSESFHTRDKEKDNSMVSGLLTALKMFAVEVADSEVRAFEVEGLSYHFQSFGTFYVVLVCASSQEPKQYLHELGLRFMKKFGEECLIKNNTSDASFFKSFQVDTKEILGDIIDISHSINPTKKLTTVEIFNFSEEMQVLALAMLRLEQGNLSTIANESKILKDVVLVLLEKLIEDGFLGKKTSNDEIIYFCAL